MADKGIIFSAPMVRALLEGRKTQTRRLCAWANNPNSPPLSYIVACDEPGWFGDEEGEIQFRAPYAPGDRLYVREHWKTSIGNDGVAPRDLDPMTPVHFLADGAEIGKYPVGALGTHRQGMHMPRWASRLWLLVTDVRVQRVQEISEEDAIAEGIEPIDAHTNPRMWTNYGHSFAYLDPRKSFASLWNSLHTKSGETWEANPWIVAVTFEVNRGNIDGGDHG